LLRRADRLVCVRRVINVAKPDIRTNEGVPLVIVICAIDLA
jgi:hypothetical protein